MSIDRDTFEQSSEEALADLSNPDRVLGFLRANEYRAYEASEIAKQTELEAPAVSTALSRLKERGLVEHKATYWAITDDESRLREYEGYERATKLFNDRYGAEDAEEWADHAPERSHPSSEGG